MNKFPVFRTASSVILALALTPGCSSRSTPAVEKVPMTIEMTSDDFVSGQPIPKRCSGDGDDKSPQLAWTNVPAGTRQLALICDDPDAPTPEPWVHWVIYGIMPSVSSLPSGLPTDETLDSPIAAVQGKNSWPSGQTIGYRGPAPPPGHGVHHYHFKLYALDAELNLKPGLTKRELLAAIAGHTLAEGELIGTYKR